MNPECSQRGDLSLQPALERPAGEREAWLRHAFPRDDALAQEVRSPLASY